MSSIKYLSLFYSLKGIWVATHNPPPKQPPINPPPPPVTDINIREIVLETIKRYKNGESSANIREITGLEKKQVSNALYYLKKRDKIILTESGLYKAV